MTSSIRVKGLSKVYPENVNERREQIRAMLAENPSGREAGNLSFALRDVSFDIADGERVGVIGANGAGKTTLMRILADLSQPSLGTVECDGKVHAILTIGTGLREDLTGRDNLLIAARLAGNEESALPALTEKMVDFAELDHFIDWPVRTYSSGMKARLSFAGSIFIEPEILLIDEALSVGDQKFAGKANEAIRKLCGSGRIVMIVSHSTEAIAAMCERCIWLEHGRLVKDGPAREVAAEYEESARLRFEKAMVGSSKRRSTAHDPRIAAISELAVAMVDTPPASDANLGSPTLHIAFEVTLKEALPSLEATLTIERLDGLVVSQSVMHLDAQLEAGSLPLSIAVPEFRVNSGFFVVDLTLTSGQTLLARLRGQIQVDADSFYTSGQPTLHWPIALQVK